MSSDDSHLVSALRRGEPSALRELYGLFADRTFRFLLRSTNRRDVAEDLNQETWISAARNALTLSADTNLAAWLFTIARNKHRSWLRRQALRPPDEPLAEQHVPAVSEQSETLRDLERALGSLPVQHREVLLLIACEGMEGPQAAAVLGISDEALRQRLSRARSALQDALSVSDHTARKGAAR